MNTTAFRNPSAPDDVDDASECTGYESLIKFWLRSCAVVDGCLVSLNDTHGRRLDFRRFAFSPSDVLSSRPVIFPEGPEMSSIANNFPGSHVPLPPGAGRYLPALITLLVVVAMLAHGVIVQPVGYHDFADHSQLAGCRMRRMCFPIWKASRWWARWGGCALPRTGSIPVPRRRGGLPVFLIGLMLTAVARRITTWRRTISAWSGIACRSRWPVPD